MMDRDTDDPARGDPRADRRSLPLGVPWLDPDQVAPAAVSLASDAAAMVTGAAYDVTGGDSAHDTA